MPLLPLYSNGTVSDVPLENCDRFSAFFESFLDGTTAYGSYFEFEQRYAAELGGADRADHVIHTSFEALKQQPAESMKALGQFLGVERSQEFYEKVVEKTSFENVKAKRDAQNQ